MKRFGIMFIAAAVVAFGLPAYSASSKETASIDSFIALKDYNRALFKVKMLNNPELIDWYKGYIYYGLCNADSAILYFQKIINDKKEDDRLKLSMSEAYLWKKDYANAKRMALSITLGTYDRSYAYLQVLEVQAKDLKWTKHYSESRNLYKEIIDSKETPESQRVRAIVESAEIAAWQEHFDQALNELSSALNIAPRNEAALLLKGKILEWQGEYSKAKKIYIGIVESNSNAQEAKQRLEKLMWVK
jgi:tetratricopeptide (TPR) repeat protein